jgi:hypothetical protein
MRPRTIPLSTFLKRSETSWADGAFSAPGGQSSAFTFAFIASMASRRSAFPVIE